MVNNTCIVKRDACSFSSGTAIACVASTAQHSTTHHTTQYNTVQHNAIQCSTCSAVVANSRSRTQLMSPARCCTHQGLSRLSQPRLKIFSTIHQILYTYSCFGFFSNSQPPFESASSRTSIKNVFYFPVCLHHNQQHCCCNGMQLNKRNRQATRGKECPCCQCACSVSRVCHCCASVSCSEMLALVSWFEQATAD